MSRRFQEYWESGVLHYTRGIAPVDVDGCCQTGAKCLIVSIIFSNQKTTCISFLFVLADESFVSQRRAGSSTMHGTSFSFDKGMENIASPVQNKSKLSPVYLDNPSDAVPTLSRKRKRRIAFGWYGGKFSHLDWLPDLLPEAPHIHHYCEPFAGSAAVLLNRAPASVETYNDIDGEVVNFFRVLRDQHDELIRTIALTPFSREEYHQAIYDDTQDISAIERARRFYIRARQTRTGLAQTASLGRWANCKNTSRGGMSGVVSRWLGGVEALDSIAQRLLRVQIENRPAVDVIRLYDSPQTLFYCDPPYLHATRGDSKAYGFEMDESQHKDLAQVLNDCQGMVAVSGYEHPLMDELFPQKKWIKTKGADKTIHSTKDKRAEFLWTNYDPHQQKELFS